MRKRLLAPLAAVLFTATLGAATRPGDPPACVVARRWVAAHRNALPTTLPALSRQPMARRRAIYDVLPAATRASLWRQQLEDVLRSNASLTGAQRATLREMIAQLPTLVRHNPDDAASLALRNRLIREFGSDGYRQIFGTLGPPSAERNASGVLLPICACDRFTPCPEGSTCRIALCSGNSGCGPFWSDQCTGWCKYAVTEAER
ncbi:bacteriocin fulvocin C-related protein [Longimicrobium sp.]|uniref:bacteriocin fulvocin C-related protein n=1 Tax=Longimicrobium sp. TaxID=2029185 RepID=UPI002CB872E5|nr:bacteriocin fulvocin C-related protein [Longimicrobium sp.]HSU14130.1 bacteriocin fulvocin C-related protein [Longimicrobium sp.]